LDINAPTLWGTIHFKALATGVNNLLSITNPILSDFNGDSIDGSIQTAFVTTTTSGSANTRLIFVDGFWSTGICS